MDREEIKNKLFDIILKNSSPTMEVKRTIDYQQTMVIVEELINHETDLLKEFVEWYGEQVARDRNGRPIARVVASLDEWVEWFLEERK